MDFFISVFPGYTYETFQMLHPSNKYLIHEKQGRPQKQIAALDIYNTLGADAYFTVNVVAEGYRREASSIVTLRAVFAEYDNGMPATVALPPTARISSSPGKEQWYWVLREPLPAAAHREHWQQVENAVVYATGGDTNARDVARILRVPGFINHKYPAKPRVTLLEVTDRRYTLDELEHAFPPAPITVTAKPRLNATAGEVSDLPPVEHRVARWLKWLGAIPVPAAGRGERNGFYYRLAAAGLRDFALPAEEVVTQLEAHSARHHADAAYDRADVTKVVSNAARTSRHAVGAAFAQSQVTSIDVEV